MPAVSTSQQGFMGMVRAVQEGRMPLHKASPRVRHVAMTMDPKDVSHFSATKHKGLPEHVGDPAEKKAGVLAWMGMSMAKAADVTAVLNNVRKSVNAVGESRRKVLQDETKKLRQHNEKLQKELQKVQMDAAKQQAVQQATANATPQPGPAPPPAQVPYGAMLTQQMAGQEDPAQGGQPKKL